VNLNDKLKTSSNLLYLTKTALDSGALTQEVRGNVIESIIEIGKKKMMESISFAENDDAYAETSYCEGLASLLSILPFNNESKEILLSLERTEVPSIMLITASALIKNEVSIPVQDLEKIAEDPSLRIQLYNNLKDMGKLRVFPTKYLSQENFAQSFLWDYVTDDYAPSAMNLIATKQIKYKNEKQIIYVYEYRFEDDDTTFIGVSGPYQRKGKLVTEAGDLLLASYEPYEKSSKLDDVLKKLFQDYEADVELIK
jgi:hypothetical protein